jgi:hypothetical protein
MIISLCSYLADSAGNFMFAVQDNDSDFSFMSRRVSRSATLDGGAIIVDNGYSASDATFNIVPRDIDNATRLSILAMVKRHSALLVSVGGNIFQGVVETVSDKDALKIKFLVSKQLNS